ncbi:unnamed protein product [Pleuronectes platessa]|uniref:Uncharacterized protein n=1 Tax=Pleuronectes platessa TaxID=8262 RepID=A0A9N7UJC4_PLEPL|nr:unnamed protein product [Pleuronectes platessa]
MNSLNVPSESNSPVFSSDEFLSASFPEYTLRQALATPRRSYSPDSNWGNLLFVPDYNAHLSPTSDRGGRMSSSSSMSDLASPSADLFSLKPSEGHQIYRHSTERLSVSPSNSLSPVWLSSSPVSTHLTHTLTPQPQMH